MTETTERDMLQTIVETYDLEEKLRLIAEEQRKGMTPGDVCGAMRMRTDHFAELLAQSRFRWGTLVKLSKATGVPAGVWLWPVSRVIEYLGVR